MKQIKFYTLAIFLCFTLIFNYRVHAQIWNLDSCITYALKHNQELLAKFHNKDIAKFEMKSALSQFAPEISLSAGIDHYWKIPVQSYPGEIIGQEAGSTIAIPIGTPWMSNNTIDLRWKVVDIEAWQEVKIKRLQSQAAVYNNHSLQRILTRNVTAAYYSAQIHKQNVLIGVERVNTYKETHALILQLFEKGIIDRISLNQSQSIMNKYQDNYWDKEAEYQNCLLDLKFWMGYPIIDTLFISNTDEMLLSPTISEYIPLLLPDYTEQKMKVDIAQHEYNLHKSSFLPKLSIIGSFGETGFGDRFKDLTTSSSWYSNGFIGFRLQIPLFSISNVYSAKRYKVALNQAKIEFSNYEEQERKYYSQLQLGAGNALRKINTQKEAIRLAEENERLYEKRLSEGIINMLQLKQIQQDLIVEQDELNKAKLDFMKNQVELNYLQSNR